MYLLDTNVISELRKAKSGKANTNLIAWAHTAPVSSQFLSCITILELELGVLRLEQRDQHQGAVCGRGLKSACCLHWRVEFCLLILTLPNPAPGCMCPISGQSETPSSPPQPWLME